MESDTRRPRITSAAFVRQFGRWQEEAARQPLSITHHGRDRLVVMSEVAYARLVARAG